MTTRIKQAGLLALTLAVLVGLTAPPSEAQVTAPGSQYAFTVQAVDDNGTAITTGRCRVLTNATFNTDAPTVYSDATLATAFNTLTATGWAPAVALDANGQCRFFMNTSTTTVDVIIMIDSGQFAGGYARIDGVTRTAVKRAVFNKHIPYRHLAIPYLQNTATQTSTIKLPAGAIVTAAAVEVDIAVAASTVSFGYAGGAVTSFCSAVSSTPVGFAICSVGLSVSVGTAASALQYSTSAHAVAGMLHVWYLEAGGN